MGCSPCCGVMSLKTGCKTIAILHMVISSVYLIFTTVFFVLEIAVLLAKQDDQSHRNNRIFTISSYWFPSTPTPTGATIVQMFIFLVVTSVLYLVLSSILYQGVKEECTRKCQIWMIAQYMFTFIYLSLFLTHLYLKASPLFLLKESLPLLVNFYFILVVGTFTRNIRMDDQSEVCSC